MNYHSSIPMRRSRLLQPGDFYYTNQGWKDGEPKSFYIHVAFPPRGMVLAAYEVYWAPISMSGGKIAEDRWWDGDLEQPTIAGSWEVEHYHCWVHKGILTLYDPGKSCGCHACSGS